LCPNYCYLECKAGFNGICTLTMAEFCDSASWPSSKTRFPSYLTRAVPALFITGNVLSNTARLNVFSQLFSMELK
jgi:hypothetical protein